MPDVFNSEDENKNDVIMHKRVPLPNPAKSEEFVLPSSPEVIESAVDQPSKTVIAESSPLSPVAKEDIKEGEVVTDVASQEKQSPFPNSALFEGEEKRNAAIPLFTSFWQNPQGVYFDTQEANEHILLFLRRHFITNIPWIFVSILFSLALPLAAYVIAITNYQFTLFPPSILHLGIFAYYLIIFTYAYLHFLDWYYNISLITAKRVMDIEMKDLVYKKISATKISLVQDVNYQQTGAIRTVFNYGEVLIQTAGAEDNFYINAVPKPEVVVRIVEELIGKRRDDEPGV